MVRSEAPPLQKACAFAAAHARGRVYRRGQVCNASFLGAKLHHLIEGRTDALAPVRRVNAYLESQAWRAVSEEGRLREGDQLA